MDGMLAELAELRAENLRLTAALEAASELQDDAEAYADGRGGGVAAVEAASCAAAQARGKDADPRPDAARRAGTALDGARPVRRVQ